MQDLQKSSSGAFALKWKMVSEKLIQDHTRGENVGARIHRLGIHLLR
jgi:hypothetical protein